MLMNLRSRRAIFRNRYEVLSVSSSYSYEALSQPEADFGLLLLKATRASSDALTCDLQIFRLGAEATPAYESLSYCWGDPATVDRIELDGKSHYATDSLGSFLRRQVGQDTTDQCLWIDALCIDQDNEEEKACQVSIMGRIYSNASRLLLIGPGDEVGEGNSGLILVSEFDQDLPSVMRPRTLSPEEFVSFRSILQRPWFDRLWMVQELVLGAKNDRTMGLCGRDRVAWTTLVKFVLRVDRFNSEYRHQFPLLHKVVDLE